MLQQRVSLQRSDSAGPCKLHPCTLVLHQMRIRIACLMLGLAACAHAADLPPATRAVLTRHGVPEAGVSIVVRDVATGGKLLELNSALPRSPASTMKVLPTWAALDLLGPAYAWKTRALAHAPVARRALQRKPYLPRGGHP